MVLTGQNTMIGTNTVLFTDDEPLPFRSTKPDLAGRTKIKHRKHDSKRQRTNGDPRLRRMIAWDGEGINLHGDGKPQDYVLFGCSADRDNPLVIENENDPGLDFIRIANYALMIAKRFPRAFHFGFFFQYDQNMIFKSLSDFQKLKLYYKGKCSVRDGIDSYLITWVPGKRIRISRFRDRKQTGTICIDDMGSFFAKSFVKSYASLFPNRVESDDFKIVLEGKQQRGSNSYADMPDVLHYWQSEIKLLEDLGERFRQILYDAEFLIRDWYGPGAIANYLRRSHGLAISEWGGKQDNLPTEVHTGSKCAYYGGRFEQYQVGRIAGPIYVYDINSAYPYAFTQLPSLKEGGKWIHRDDVRIVPGGSARFAVYRIQYCNKRAGLIPHDPQPLPHRNREGNVSYPSLVDGWYWWPEAHTAQRFFKQNIEIVDCWEWIPAEPTERPWSFIQDMFNQRLELKQAGNPTEMAFKLGMNSLYGKMAQKAGWDQEHNLPPRAHTLPIAGMVTSYCRAMILEFVSSLNRAHGGQNVIAIETDSVITTVPFDDRMDFELGPQLGQWSCEIYDEIIYIQNGVYIARKGDKWNVKSRGIDKNALSYEVVTSYLRELKANQEWPELKLPDRQTFLGLGTAISRSMTRSGKLNPFALRKLHCRWDAMPKSAIAGMRGKRRHIPALCPQCKLALSANDEMALSANEVAHRLHVHSFTWQEPVSMAYRLPWEQGFVPAWQDTSEEISEEIFG